MSPALGLPSPAASPSHSDVQAAVTLNSNGLTVRSRRAGGRHIIIVTSDAALVLGALTTHQM
jgi:hypothetical protein